jgi:hypothetical protein
MPVTDKIAALFAALTREEVDALPPAERRRFADVCRHWADFADIRPGERKARTGVLAELRRELRND